MMVPEMMKRSRLITAAGLFIAATMTIGAQTARTPWGDPDLQGEWTSEGEYGVPFERPPLFFTRQLLTD